MIKSELVQRIASQNPHLYQRDVENIVNAILGEIVTALARGDRVELRGFGAFFRQEPPGPGRPQPADRRACRGRPKKRAVLQDRQGNARTPQPPGHAVSRAGALIARLQPHPGMRPSAND
jgi:hypothetical protein